MGVTKVSKTAELNQARNDPEQAKLTRTLSLTNMMIKETRQQFSNSTWTSTVYSSPTWSQCEGPQTDICKVWNADFENSNGRGWNGGQWPPK